MHGVGCVSATHTQAQRNVVSGHWGNFADAQSNISGYTWGLGTAPGLDNIFSFVELGQRTSFMASGLQLQDGMVVYSTLIACNHAHLCVTVSSDGVLVDGSPPVLVRHTKMFFVVSDACAAASCVDIIVHSVTINFISSL